MVAKGLLLGEILANEPIGIFIESTFPSGIGMCKEEAPSEGFRDGYTAPLERETTFKTSLTA